VGSFTVITKVEERGGHCIDDCQENKDLDSIMLDKLMHSSKIAHWAVLDVDRLQKSFLVTLPILVNWEFKLKENYQVT